MKKNLVKINENTLRQIVAESVKRVLKENKEINEPNIKMLGDGVYEGALWGHTFLYKGKNTIQKKDGGTCPLLIAKQL